MQATIAAPVKGKMFKGLCVCYSVIATTYFGVAVSGYWAFGNETSGTIIANFMGQGKPLLPTWFLLMINIFTLVQVLAVTVVRNKYYLLIIFQFDFLSYFIETLVKPGHEYPRLVNCNGSRSVAVM